MKKNGFAPLIIIILIAILGVVGYFIYKNSQQTLIPANPTASPASPSTLDSDLTGSWKTFTSNLYGFTIEYPESINPPADSPMDNSLNPPASGYMQFYLPDNQDSLSVKVWDNPSGLNAHDWITKTDDEERKNGANLIQPESEKDTVINGVSAYQSINFAGDGNEKDTYFAKGNYVIQISFYDTNTNITDQEKSKAIFEKMLSTFKFTK